MLGTRMMTLITVGGGERGHEEVWFFCTPVASVDGLHMYVVDILL